MAYLHRLIVCALVALSAWLPAISFAYPASSSGGNTEYSTRTYTNTALTATGFASSWAAACELSRASVTGLPANHLPIGVQVGASNCVVYSSLYGWSKLYDAGINSRVVPVVLSCPSGGTLSTSSCICSGTQIDTGSACTAPVDPNIKKCADAKGGVDLFTGHVSFSKFGAAYCPSDGAGANCGATVTGGFGTVKAGVTTWTYEVSYTGSVCVPPATSGTGTPTDSTGGGAPTTCKGTPGVVNGVTVCIPMGKGDTNVVQSEKGGTSATGETVTEETETKCTGTRCTTTTTTTTTPPTVDGVPGVPSSKTETKEEPKDDFCVKNPRSAMCVVSSLSAGACGAPDVCDGDAIQCAIASLAKKTACALNPTPDGSDADYLAAKALTGKQTGGLPGNDTVSIGPGSFDTSDALGGGSCISDKVVTVAGHAVTLPFSAVCGSLALLGNVLMLVSFLLAGRIVVRG